MTQILPVGRFFSSGAADWIAVGKSMADILKQSQTSTVIDFNQLKQYAQKSLNQIIYEDLKGKILRGDIAPATRLQEDRLAKTYQTSRTPVRDALRKLDQENVLKKLDYGGYLINELTLDEIEEIFELRAVIESYAAFLATSRISEAEIEKMEEILEDSRSAIKKEDFESFIELNTDFHALLYKASRGKHVLRILQGLWDYFYRHRKTIFTKKSNLEDSLRGHERMLQTMKSGDAEGVEKLVRQHIREALAAFKKESKKKE